MNYRKYKRHRIDEKHSKSLTLNSQNLRECMHITKEFTKRTLNMTRMAAHYEKLWKNKTMMPAFISRHFIYYPASKEDCSILKPSLEGGVSTE